MFSYIVLNSVNFTRDLGMGPLKFLLLRIYLYFMENEDLNIIN